jgi:hypothetical protein
VHFHTYINKIRGTKLSKKRLSVAFCVNASGRHPEKPIIIGHNKKPHPNNWWWKKDCSYAYKKNAWMTMEIWEKNGRINQRSNFYIFRILMNLKYFFFPL